MGNTETIMGANSNIKYTCAHCTDILTVDRLRFVYDPQNALVIEIDTRKINNRKINIPGRKFPISEYEVQKPFDVNSDVFIICHSCFSLCCDKYRHENMARPNQYFNNTYETSTKINNSTINDPDKIF